MTPETTSLRARARARAAMLALFFASASATAAATTQACSSGSSGGTGDGGTTADGGSDATSAMDGSTRDPLLPVGACRRQSDCDQTTACVTPRKLPAICNGACEPSVYTAECTSDATCADAGTGMICSGPSTPSSCFCFSGGAVPAAHCVKGCLTNADCGLGLTCGTTHRCEAAPCSQPADCGSASFSCTASTCAVKSCTVDSDCPTYCVNGACSAAFGSCLAPMTVP